MTNEQKAEAIAQEYAQQFKTQASSEGLQNIASDYLAGYLAGAVAEKEEWVSVDDRLPEPDPEDPAYSFMVLLWISGEAAQGYYKFETQKWRKAGSWVSVTPSHWRPLPSPPKTI